MDYDEIINNANDTRSGDNYYYDNNIINPSDIQLTPIVGVQTSGEIGKMTSFENETANTVPFGTSKDDTYELNGEQLYDTNEWIVQHQKRYDEFMENPVVDFVSSVAGDLNQTTEDLLKTGFEDIVKLLQKNQPRPYKPLSTYDYANVFARDPKNLKREWDSVLETMSMVYDKDEQLVSSLPNIVAYAQNRYEKREQLITEWKVMALNVKKLHFKEFLKSAVEWCVTLIQGRYNLQNIASDELFLDIIQSNFRSVFVNLVAGRIKENRADRGYASETKYNHLSDKMMMSLQMFANYEYGQSTSLLQGRSFPSIPFGLFPTIQQPNVSNV